MDRLEIGFQGVRSVSSDHGFRAGRTVGGMDRKSLRKGLHVLLAVGPPICSGKGRKAAQPNTREEEARKKANPPEPARKGTAKKAGAGKNAPLWQVPWGGCPRGGVPKIRANPTSYRGLINRPTPPDRGRKREEKRKRAGTPRDPKDGAAAHEAARNQSHEQARSQRPEKRRSRRGERRTRGDSTPGTARTAHNKSKSRRNPAPGNQRIIL